MMAEEKEKSKLKLWKKKEEVKKQAPKFDETSPTSLYKICKDLFGEKGVNIEELYEAVSFTVAPDPSELVKNGMGFYEQKIKENEKSNRIIAAANCWNAGRLALYEGDLKKAQEYFAKYVKIYPESPFIKSFKFYEDENNAAMALQVAQEYYKRAKIKT